MPFNKNIYFYICDIEYFIYIKLKYPQVHLIITIKYKLYIYNNQNKYLKCCPDIADGRLIIDLNMVFGHDSIAF